MLSKDDIIAALREGEPTEFVRNILFGNDCWLFEQRGIRRPEASYRTLQNNISGALNINPNQVHLIGSAKLGFSIAPGKALRDFRLRRSDLDVAIVSPEIFDSAWEQLTKAYLQGYTAYAENHAKQIFCKFMILDSDVTHKSTYLRELSEVLLGLNRAVNLSVRIPHDVRYRIYQGWGAVESYHIEGINTVRKELRNGNAK